MSANLSLALASASALTSLTPSLPAVSGGVIADLGWTLIHFLWQGALLVLPLQSALALCPGARARYNFAYATLLCMAAAPIATFLFIHHHPAVETPMAAMTVAIPAAVQGGDIPLPAPVNWTNWVVIAWFAGVALFTLRLAGGWYAASDLRRRETRTLPPALLRRCRRIAAALAISRPVTFLQSAAVSAPAAIGWLRPVVLLPAAALTGLPPEQLDAVIAHELGHVLRFDALANLVQMLVETLLFYHPAVWWVSRRIRIERENCCDDIAVALSGDALSYARALTSLEEWRAVPAPMMAANGGVLKQRIARLLGLHMKARNTSAIGVAAIGLVCLAGCMVAHGQQDAAAAPASTEVAAMATPAPAEPAPQLLVQPAAPALPAPPVAVAPLPPLPPLPMTNIQTAIQDATREAMEQARELAQQAREQALAQAEEAREEARRVRDEARAERDRARAEHDRDGVHAGSRPLSTDDESYIAAMNAAGLKDVSADQIVALKNRGIAPSYVSEMRAAGIEPSVSQIMALASMGVTPEYVRTVRAAWPGITTRDLIGMHAVGIDPKDAATFKQLGIGDLSVHELMSFKALGVTPEFVRALQAAGLKDLSPHDYGTAKVLGITPEFIASARDHGFKDLSLRQLFALKNANVL